MAAPATWSRDAPPPGEAELPRYAEAVLDVVDTVPTGRVTTYGDIAAVLRAGGLGGGPRSVGQVMARYGGAVAWWRVVRSDGGAPACDPAAARRCWQAERLPLRGERVDLTAARARLRAPAWLAEAGDR